MEQHKDDYFNYQREGELLMACTQCGLCAHNVPETPNVCEKYPEWKPAEVVKGEIRCKYLEVK